MASIYRDVSSYDVIIRLALGDLENDPRGLAEIIHDDVRKFLADEFIKKYGAGILDAIHPDDIAYSLKEAVVEAAKRKLLGESHAG